MIRCGVLTISDRSSQGIREDRSGPLIQEILTIAGYRIVCAEIIPDEFEMIRQILVDWCATKDINLLLTTGGTGFAPRDITPEATRSVVEKIVPGIPETMRHESMKKTPHAMLSRSVAGILNKTLIINLPGSPKAVQENLDILLPVLPHAIELLVDETRSETGHNYHQL